MAGIQRHDNDDLDNDNHGPIEHHDHHDPGKHIDLDLDDQLADNHAVYLNHPDIDAHLDHLIAHPYDHDYYYDPIHHFITRRHNDATIAAQFNDDCRPFLTDNDTEANAAED